MSIELNVQATDLSAFGQFITKDIARQLNFVESLALNRFAKSTVEIVRSRMTGRFILRNNFTQRGVTFNPSSKNQSDIFVEIGARDDFLVLQEKGGKKKISGSVAVPVTGSRGIRKTQRQIVRKSKRPKKILRGGTGRKKPFVIDAGAGKRLIVKRRGKKRAPLDVLFFLDSSAPRVEPRFMFFDDVQEQANTELEKTFSKTFAEVILAPAGQKLQQRKNSTR